MSRYNKDKKTLIDKITLSLATDKDVQSWSNGEVTKPETINYKSYKPEREGLFDEIIFGPTTDYKCPVCNTKYKRSDENTDCVRTPMCVKHKPKILPKISRRSRMGHIQLKNPVVHFWFFKIDHSIISKLLGLKVANSSRSVTKSELEKLIYYKSHIVLEDGGLKSLKKNTIIDISEAALVYFEALKELRENFDPQGDEYDQEAYEVIDEALNDLREQATSKMGQDYGIDFYEYNEIIHEYSDALISTGSKAIEYLLENVNPQEEADKLEEEIRELSAQIAANPWANAKIQERAKLYKRFSVINAFIKSGQDPKSMLIYNLPVIPADLRPLVQLDGGRHSTSDINELYRRIIIRNNRLKKWEESDAPMLIKQNEYRMIQEAVDSLIDNARRKPNPVASKDGRPFKSISDALTGKKGRFRQNLLGKRVDYSGRSVIVVGPELKMHQVGIPREMAAKLFEPWIINELIKSDKNSINSIKAGKKAVENLDPIIWPYVEKAIEGRPVLLNRAPTLHRLSIQAYEPVLIRGKAIKLHPLSCTPFNADFDGDQMAVHVPISPEATREARELMLASKNILGPKDGEPIINPGQDMILGLYYLTMEKAGGLGEGRFFATYEDMLTAYENKAVSIHSRVVLPIEQANKKWINSDEKNKYIISTVGKFIFNRAFPNTFEFIFGKYITPDGKEIVHTSAKGEHLSHYLLPAGSNFPELIAQMPINLALTKKDIAKIVRRVYDQYVSVICMEDLAAILQDINSNDLDKIFEKCASLTTYNNETLNSSHAEILTKLITEEFNKINHSVLNRNELKIPAWNIEDHTLLLEKVWFKYTNVVANVLDKIKSLGFHFSTISGTTIAVSDVITLPSTKDKIKEGEAYIEKLKSFFAEGMLTDDERYSLSIKKWAEIKNSIEDELKKVTKSDPHNPLFMMFTSGARGNSSNFVQLAGMRGLMNNNVKILKADAENERVVRSTVEIPVKSSFLEGLTAYEFYSSTHGARKGLTDTALNTAKSGYLTRRLVDVAQGIVVREEDCGTDYGFVVRDIKDSKTNTIIESLAERIEGRFTNKPVIDADGNQIIGVNELITPEIASQISENGIEEVEIRSVLSCYTRNGVCKKCYGKDLALNRVVNIGEAVGVVAAQSIGEPGTQLTMRTFHTGGVAGVVDITGGFGRLMELIDAYDSPWGRPAIIAPGYGRVNSITTPFDHGRDFKVIEIEIYNEKGELETIKYETKADRRIVVKEGQKLQPGQKIVEGPIVLGDLLKYADTRSVQNYLLKEIQKLYRLQGISIADKYIEIIIRQMLSKVLITDPGDSRFFSGSLVDILAFQKESARLLAKGQKPPFGEVKIKGAKQTPLLSDSFLAAASYQETPKILVNASIASQTDNLEGLKENIILGHKIPAGTNSNFELKGKYDIRDPRSYFSGKYEDISADIEQPHDFIFDMEIDHQQDIDEMFRQFNVHEVEDNFSLLEEEIE
ncbi:DNA-directed RNA polymerase beta' chain [Mycoplasmopsis californica HAZ160_1]|uniref:DNA-directed RNA polymerase subunit beta' n=1 Tax=Mycoplasmopsis californica HAZ160_1 TaxID=1397850 RepID=A0AAT9F7W8_9BACT|nr:DNA-directed RNA polymerase subunit beta' [Mycoplasmopsis californica]BAP01000.1 DNA-directed RNA polymerase beta' chain [Mycoplasmopsis californica HAZ160_1]BBG40865.1 DNA-directed RNA polymerase beta' chain [Mycoplasmopsis californica]BBG42635.1 DNA-directed RNA polymerase beta' chain [Mycoplasmopsis californica]BBG43210.1 DNA-directed RNA polymerase beta' chain [Mycoplasmopsis californica]